MSGVSVAGKRESFRSEHPSLCEFVVDRNGKQKPCQEAAYNVIYSGHNYRGVPYVSHYCDQHDKERL